MSPRARRRSSSQPCATARSTSPFSSWTAPSRDGLVHRTCMAAGFEPNIAFVTRDVLAFRELVASGLAVTLTGRLLAGRLEGIATPAVKGDPARRTIYAVRPSTDSHPLTDRLLAELTGRASDALSAPAG